MEALLEKMIEFHRILIDLDFKDLTLEEVGNYLKRQIHSNFFIFSPSGKVLYLSDGMEHSQEDLASRKLPRNFLEEAMELPNLLILPRENLDNTPWEGTPTQDPNGSVMVIQIWGDHRHLCSVFAWTEQQSMQPDDLVLFEVASAMLSMVCCRSKNKAETAEQMRFAAARIAVSVLSYTELNAVKELMKVMEGDHCTLVVNELANKVFITRSVISNALHKLESAELIQVKSLGVKGTYVKILNPYLREALSETKEDLTIPLPKSLFYPEG